MKISWNLKRKFNLLLLLIFIVGTCLSGLVLSKILYQQSERKITDEGDILMQMIEEIKYYTSVNLLELYQENQGEENLGFRPAYVPAYAARQVFNNFQNRVEFENYQYKEATLNPTNLKDLPNDFEQELIYSFRQNRQLNLLSGYIQKSNENFYYISRPLTVKDNSCLQCHSTPDVAPPRMLEIYGDRHGFNWKLDQLTSAQTIYIPASNIGIDVRQGMFTVMPMFTGIFAVLLFSIDRLLQHTVIKPINQLTKAANQLSKNSSSIIKTGQSSYLTKLTNRGDESGKLAQTFLMMAEKISNRQRDLHQAVENSTKELKQEIRDRIAVQRRLANKVKRILLQEKITQEIRQSLDTYQILETAVNNVGRAFKVSRCQIFSYADDQSRKAKVVAEYVLAKYPRTLHLEISLNEAICLNKAMSQEKAVYWSNVCHDPLLKPSVHIYQRLEIKSLLTIKTSYQGKVNGAISIQQCDRDRPWQTEEVEFMESVSAQIGIALAQAELLQQEKQRRQEIEAAKQEAELANRSKSEFLANISHELRTPLNAIIGFSQLMNRDPGINPQQQETVNIINRSGEHLLEMINEVLEMSKIEAGRTELHLADVDLMLLLNTIEAMLGIKAKAKNLQLRIECSEDVPQYICTDESKLRQVLINLMGNGIKFTQTGSVTLRVSKQDTSSPSSCILMFEVEDTGAGIASEEIAQIFKAFSQSKAGRQSQQGTGLGLPISQKFVELMGGELNVKSKVGQGSIFSFKITSELTSPPPTRLPSAKVVKSLAPNQPTYRILVVDDVWQSRLLIFKLLTQVGFVVQEAENGQQALEVVQQWQPDLILMDMRMPIMDGYESTRQIRAVEHHNQEGNRGCKIIALTASAFESKRAATIEAGCNDYLRKPFKENELFATIQKHLDVVYVYQEDANLTTNNLTTNNLTATEASQLTADSLQAMPSEWLQELKQAAEELNESRLEQLISQIPQEHDQLIRTLTDLVSNFQFERIFELINSG